MGLTLKSINFNKFTDFGYQPSVFYEDHDIAQYLAEYTQSTDCSCIVMDTDLNRPVLFVPANLLNKNYSFHGWPIHPVLSKEYDESMRIKALDLILTEWNSINPSAGALFEYSNASAQVGIKRWCSIITKIESQISTLLSEEKIHANLRSSYKSLVNKGKRDLKTVVHFGNDVPWDEMKKVMDFHIQVSGRVTRSEESWKIQHRLILKNKAFLISNYYNDKLVGASHFVTDGKVAIYGTGVYDRELMAEGMPISHVNLYKAILFSKEIGCHSFTLGEVGPNYLDEKVENISKFKRGFGGELSLNTQLLIHAQKP